MSQYHNHTYTIHSPKGGHRTFRVQTQAADAEFAAGKTVVALLTGPDNNSSYTNFGFLKDDGAIHLFRKKQGDHYVGLSKMLRQFMQQGDSCQLAKLGYTCLTSKLCRRCGRKLTTPESIEAGIGPECASKALAGK